MAFSQYPRSFSDENGSHPLMGTSMRTGAYRLTRWVDTSTGIIMATELYDHSGNEPEMENLAGDEDHKELLSELSVQFEREYKREHE